MGVNHGIILGCDGIKCRAYVVNLGLYLEGPNSRGSEAGKGLTAGVG